MCFIIINRMPKHDGKDQEEASPKQAGSCWFARHSWLQLHQAAQVCILRGFGSQIDVCHHVVLFLVLRLFPSPYTDEAAALR